MKFITNLFYLLKAQFTVFKIGLRSPVTLQYPEEKKIYKGKLRGKIEFVKNNDGTYKCTRCSICKSVCPVKDAIFIEHKKDDNGKNILDNYTIDFSQCIFCGNCIEHCKFGALRMTKEFELATDNKNELLQQLKDETLWD